MLKKTVFSLFFISVIYFSLYYFVPALKTAVYSGGFWAVLHALMGIVLIIGIFGIIFFAFYYLFSNPDKK